MSDAKAAVWGPSSIIAAILDFIFPPVCQICQDTFSGDNIWICDSCRRKLRENPLPHCPICRTALMEPSAHCPGCGRRGRLAWVYSLGLYDDSYALLVKAVKYGNKPDLGGLLGAMLAAKLRTLPHLERIEAVCSVPLYRRKQAGRGFNQSAIIAAAVAKELQLPYLPDALVQIRANRDQIGLSVIERFANVAEVYVASPEAGVTGKSILLVDDVTTSGATLNATAQALRKAGALTVAAATVALATDARLDRAKAYSYLLEKD